VFSIGAASVVTGLAYAAHIENNDAFCASCHTQPESDYYQRSLTQPSDLASAHAVKSVECIQCHSGRGAIGRVSAIATVALPDLVAYRSGSFRSPAVVTNPIGDDHCLKCHATVTRRQDFNNHFHVLLSEWRARAPRDAARCVDCHQAHVTNGLVDTAFLTESTTVAVCQRCHAVLRG
jgi:predicted CXXCH cytochrome family protein